MPPLLVSVVVACAMAAAASSQAQAQQLQFSGGNPPLVAAAGVPMPVFSVEATDAENATVVLALAGAPVEGVRMVLVECSSVWVGRRRRLIDGVCAQTPMLSGTTQVPVLGGVALFDHVVFIGSGVVVLQASVSRASQRSPLGRERPKATGRD
jgi:hypothetical protein